MKSLLTFRWHSPVLQRVCGAALLVLTVGTYVFGQPVKVQTLHIGTSGTLAGEKAEKEKAALETLQSFIKEETGFDNDIKRQKDWRELGAKMANKELPIGVFQGYEFAWAQQQFPSIKPLALAVNVHPYPVVYIVVSKSNPAKDFKGLQGQILSLPGTGQRYLRLFVESQAHAVGKDAATFFSKIVIADNAEDAVDDVVEGKVQAAVADQASLESYKNRKPERFKQVTQAARSQPLPPTVIAYAEKALDDATLKKFRDGLINAANKERGRVLLMTFRLSGFSEVRGDLDKVLAESRKTYPPPK